MKKEAEVKEVEVVQSTASDKVPLLDEKTIVLFINPNNSEQVLVSSLNDKQLLQFDYDPKSGTLKQHLNQNLNKIFPIYKNIDYSQKLICVFDEIYCNTIYRVFLNTDNISNLILPNDLKFTNIKHITNKSNEKHELYLKVFLKIFSSLDLIQYFKKSV